MRLSLGRRRNLVIWQVLFLLLGTTWLLAPLLNHQLSYRTTLISQYETGFEPFSWLFRSGDLLAGLMVLAAGLYYLRSRADRTIALLLIIIGSGLALDPMLATTCRVVANNCVEYISAAFVLHAIETVITSGAIFTIAIYDSLARKRVVSIAFAVFQIAYGLLFVSQLANQDHFNTLSQFVYELSLIVWLAWFVRDYAKSENYQVTKLELRWIKSLAAIWAFLNGVAAILISLAHIHLLGRITALYFAGDSAWLAQHGVIVGIIMLYLSRHLARGERRARQIFLAVLGIEALKYSLISPNAGLLVLYALSFIALFVLRDNFQRGTVPLTRRVRMLDLYILISGLGVAVAAWILSLDRDSRISTIASRAIDNFVDYATTSDNHHMLRSRLLAQTLAVFLFAAVMAVLWILFRPAKLGSGDQDFASAENRLAHNSTSSEDFFKVWPRDKDFFWTNDDQNFVAYKKAGPVLFALADPIGTDHKAALAEFTDWARGYGYRIAFMMAPEESLGTYKRTGFSCLKIGSSALIDVNQFLEKTASEKWWRWIRNKAGRADYQYHQSTAPHSPELLSQLKVVSDAWLKIGQHTERGFAMGAFDDEYLNKCTIHYLTKEGQMIAFANEVPQFRKLQTKTIDLMRFLPDHDHSMPYLLFKVIEDTASQHVRYFDLGFVPFAKAEGAIQTIAQAVSDRRFSSKGLLQFKNKFDPQWKANYLAYDGDLADLGTIALHVEKVLG